MTTFRDPFMKAHYDCAIRSFNTNQNPVWSFDRRAFFARGGNSLSTMFWRGFDQAQPSYQGMMKTNFTRLDRQNSGYAYYAAGRDVALWMAKL